MSQKFNNCFLQTLPKVSVPLVTTGIVTYGMYQQRKQMAKIGQTMVSAAYLCHWHGNMHCMLFNDCIPSGNRLYVVKIYVPSV